MGFGKLVYILQLCFDLSFIPYLTPLFCIAPLLYRLGFPSAQEFVDYCLDSVEFVNPTPEDYLQAKDKASRYPDQTITLVDAITAVLSEKMKLPVWTYDFHFDIMGVTVWR
jgi:hypothetical protein